MSKLKPSVSDNPSSRKTPFQPAHAVQYGLAVAMRDTSGVVCSVRCQFCQYFGREEAANGKRKRTQNTKFYKAPYRPQYYADHNTSAHAVKWAAYQFLSDAGKTTFFDGLTLRSNQLISHFERLSSEFQFEFHEVIVNDLIGKLFFNLEDEQVSAATALRAFGQAENGVYTVKIKNYLRFSLAIQHLSVGLSFRQTAAVMQQTHKATGNPHLSQQMAEIDILVVRLRSLLFIQPVVDRTLAYGSNDTVSDKYWLKEQHLINFVKDQGSFVTKNLDSLQPDEKHSTLVSLGKFVLQVIEGMESVQAERNSRNEAAQLLSPPVMAAKLAQIPPREFVSDILDPRRSHLSKFWDQAQIEAVESEHRELCQANMLNDSVKAVLDAESYETDFNDGWDALQAAAAPHKLTHLRQFCCGLATVFANTASVESDFSILKWELNDRRTALTSLPLEGIFQAKQLDQLSKH